MIVGLVVHLHGRPATTVYSEVDVGATFRVYCPVSGRRGERSKAGATRTRECRYTVFDAANGEEALRLFEKHSDVIQLLLLDVVMPGLGGREVFERIHAPVLDA